MSSWGLWLLTETLDARRAAFPLRLRWVAIGQRATASPRASSQRSKRRWRLFAVFFRKPMKSGGDRVSRIPQTRQQRTAIGRIPTSGLLTDGARRRNAKGANNPRPWTEQHNCVVDFMDARSSGDGEKQGLRTIAGIWRPRTDPDIANAITDTSRNMVAPEGSPSFASQRENPDWVSPEHRGRGSMIRQDRAREWAVSMASDGCDEGRACGRQGHRQSMHTRSIVETYCFNDALDHRVQDDERVELAARRQSARFPLGNAL